MTVTSAVHETLTRLSTEQKEKVAAACNISIVSLYQCGEYDDRGDPRLSLKACKVADFCRAAGSYLVAEVIAWQMGASLTFTAGAEGNPDTDQPQTMKELTDVLSAMGSAFEDGRFTGVEKTKVLKELREFLSHFSNLGIDR